MNNFVQELKETLPFYVIEHDLLEADDIIAHLVRVESPDNKKVIVTSDTDYIQLLKYNNTKLYCPMKSMFRECETPNLELEKKIITGDKSDNIPSVRAGIGPVKALKLIESGNLEKLLEEKEADGTPGEFYRNYHRNKTLIDLNNTPQYLKTSLENLYNSYKPASGMGLFRYFTRNKMENFYSNMDYYRNLLKPLQEANS
jgi:5'-3' exonuclease